MPPSVVESESPEAKVKKQLPFIISVRLNQSHHDSMICCFVFHLLLRINLILEVSDELGKRQPRSSTPRRKGWYTKYTTVHPFKVNQEE